MFLNEQNMSSSTGQMSYPQASMAHQRRKGTAWRRGRRTEQLAQPFVYRRRGIGVEEVTSLAKTSREALEVSIHILRGNLGQTCSVAGKICTLAIEGTVHIYVDYSLYRDRQKFRKERTCTFDQEEALARILPRFFRG